MAAVQTSESATTWQMVKDLQCIGRHIQHTRDQAGHNQCNQCSWHNLGTTSGNQEILVIMQNIVSTASITMQNYRKSATPFFHSSCFKNRGTLTRRWDRAKGFSWHVTLTRHEAFVASDHLPVANTVRFSCPTTTGSSGPWDTLQYVPHARNLYMNLYEPPLIHSKSWTCFYWRSRRSPLYNVAQRRQRMISSGTTRGRLSSKDGTSMVLGTIWPLVCVFDNFFLVFYAHVSMQVTFGGLTKPTL